MTSLANPQQLFQSFLVLILLSANRTCCPDRRLKEAPPLPPHVQNFGSGLGVLESWLFGEFRVLCKAFVSCGRRLCPEADTPARSLHLESKHEGNLGSSFPFLVDQLDGCFESPSLAQWVALGVRGCRTFIPGGGSRAIGLLRPLSDD